MYLYQGSKLCSLYHCHYIQWQLWGPTSPGQLEDGSIPAQNTFVTWEPHRHLSLYHIIEPFFRSPRLDRLKTSDWSFIPWPGLRSCIEGWNVSRYRDVVASALHLSTKKQTCQLKCPSAIILDVPFVTIAIYVIGLCVHYRHVWIRPKVYLCFDHAMLTSRSAHAAAYTFLPFTISPSALFRHGREREERKPSWWLGAYTWHGTHSPPPH